jgi:hypothetical protein
MTRQSSRRASSFRSFFKASPARRPAIRAEALNAFLGSDVASKADVELARTQLDGRITSIKTELDGRITLLQWMVGFNLALTIAVLGKLLFGH